MAAWRSISKSGLSWQRYNSPASPHSISYATNNPQRSYREYKDMLLKYEQYKQDAEEKQLQISDLEKQLTLVKAAPPNGVGAAASGDSAYWKQKYDTLLASL